MEDAAIAAIRRLRTSTPAGVRASALTKWGSRARGIQNAVAGRCSPSAQEPCCSGPSSSDYAVGGGAATARAISSATDQRRRGRGPPALGEVSSPAVAGFGGELSSPAVAGFGGGVVTGSVGAVAGVRRRRRLKAPRAGFSEIRSARRRVLVDSLLITSTPMLSADAASGRRCRPLAVWFKWSQG
jgi:hypothetical protein